MAFYRQSTAYTRMFKMIDSSDHFSKKTGLTCTVNISKAGSAFGAAGGAVTETASGWYRIALTTTDTNTLGDLAFYITATGADDTDFVDQIVVRDLADLAYPTTTGRSIDVTAAGEVGIDWANIGSPTTAVALTGTTIATTQKVDIETIKTNPVVNAGTVTFPATATLASTTNITAATGVDITKILGTAISTPATAGILDVNVKNIDNDAASASGTVTFPNATLASTANITGGTITTVTNLTNAPTAGDFTAAMKTSLNNATPAVTVSDKTGFALTSAYDFAKGTVAMTESYAAAAAAMTPAQALYQINQHLGESSIVTTTKTVKKRDSSTTAKTFTLDSSTTPTSVTETT